MCSRVEVEQEARLQRVGEWHPGKISEGEHVAEAVGGDIHRREDSLLVRMHVWLRMLVRMHV